MQTIEESQKVDEGNITGQLCSDDFLHFSTQKSLEIVKREIDEVIKEENKINFIKYLEIKFLDLVELDKAEYPETYEVCAKSFNYMLRQIIENKTYKEYLLSGKKLSDMYILREEIVTFISEFIDNDIIELLSSNLEKKLIAEEDEKVQIDPIEQEQDQQHIIEDVYDPDNVDAYF